MHGLDQFFLSWLPTFGIKNKRLNTIFFVSTMFWASKIRPWSSKYGWKKKKMFSTSYSQLWKWEVNNQKVCMSHVLSFQALHFEFHAWLKKKSFSLGLLLLVPQIGGRMQNVLLWPCIELPSFVFRPLSMVEIFLFCFWPPTFNMKLRGWKQFFFLNLFIQECFLQNLMFQVRIEQSWINVRFCGFYFISKYILQSHIDAITCRIEEWNNSWNLIWKNGPSYNREVIKIDYGFYEK
jgi:hypothetical protein